MLLALFVGNLASISAPNRASARSSGLFGSRAATASVGRSENYLDFGFQSDFPTGRIRDGRTLQWVLEDVGIGGADHSPAPAQWPNRSRCAHRIRVMRFCQVSTPAHSSALIAS